MLKHLCAEAEADAQEEDILCQILHKRRVKGDIRNSSSFDDRDNDGKNVTIVEMADTFLANSGSSCQAYNIAIAQSNIKIMTGKRLVAVEDNGVVLIDRWGNENTVDADNVVIAAGFTPQYDLANQLEENTEMEVYNIGDSKKVRQIYDAIHEGFIAARQI